MATGQFDPNTAQNLVEIEKQFAVKAVEHAQTYWNLLEKVNPRDLKLTKLDEEIFDHVMKDFPELAEAPHDKITKLDEEWMKSKEGKERWRVFIASYENKVKDYNFGSLIRTDARDEYSELNTIFVTRIQFYAFEICRNRLGLNDRAHEIAKEEAEKEKIWMAVTISVTHRRVVAVQSWHLLVLLALHSLTFSAIMDGGDVFEISSGDSDGEHEEYIDRRTILEPAIRSVVDALGGYEDGHYRLGDEAYGCLKDLKKFWRKDDTDDERTVARIFWDTGLLPNDLISILLETAGKGNVEDKRAVACADLMTAMTWPIDLAEELKELDEELDKGTDYTQLLTSHLHYKAALLKPGVIQALFGIMVPCLAKETKERKERDVQVINVVLFLIRNLAFIKDPPANMHLSSDQAEYSSLQSKLVRTLSETHIFDLLLTIASNAADDALFNGWNTLVLEIMYLLFRGIKPPSLTMDQAKQPAATLHRLLEVESRIRRDVARTATSRHSRFGTTISVKLNPKKARANDNEDQPQGEKAQSSLSSQTLVLHRQQAINGEAGGILDLLKRQKAQKGKKIDELGREDNLSVEARVILQNLAQSFIQSCFNPFLSSLLKDIKSERAKVTEKDNLRLLYVTKWFLEFFICGRAKGKGNEKDDAWSFGLIAEVTERGWIVWVLKRMREAVDEKPKLWTELQAGIECLTQLLALIDSMTAPDVSDPSTIEAAEVLQQQLIYSGEVLEISFDSLRSYKEGTQSLAYLDSSVHLAYGLFRMLEKWSKVKGEMYVRKRVKARKKKSQGKSTEEGDGVPDVEDDEISANEEDIIRETKFTLETFELKFAHSEITHTLLTYLGRYPEFSSSEQMKRVVSLLHRQAIKAKAEGLLFQASTLELFKSILTAQKVLSKEQPYKDLVALVNFVVRKFFKAVTEEPLLIVEAFFPKNRGQWKHFSSWEPEKTKGDKALRVEDTRFPPDVYVKKGHTWSEQLGIAIACLLEAGKMEVIEWVKDVLTVVIQHREKIIAETDKVDDTDDGSENDLPKDDGEEEANLRKRSSPSGEALAKIDDYLIPYISDQQADAASKNPYLKLVFRLLKFAILDEVLNVCADEDELQWFVPSTLLPSDLQSSLNVIDQFLKNPMDLGGKKASDMLSKKARRRRRRRSPSPNSDDESDILDDKPKKKREKKKKEEKQYKSAQFIEDSDVDDETLHAFFEKEQQLREKTALAAVDGKLATMRATGTKKRRKTTAEGGRGRKKRKGATAHERASSADPTQADDPQSDSDVDIFGSPRERSSTPRTTPPMESDSVLPSKPKMRPRPKPRFKGTSTTPSAPLDDSAQNLRGSPLRSVLSSANAEGGPPNDIETSSGLQDHEGGIQTRLKGRMILSDDEE
ncbi:hypothetical protein JAAARDRAFT_79123 [Jaapia argillacea MUCL 33604]|uniref:Timeless N-terminal domain-containing protein n=1 Tax=Jaapia argillacea MUCL 33604 TaxID=933084 RepID=A0A067PP57_9AGAM|nr:hypothetical protein JAAARDRAFT_79123 [Jaapia argillacea MUCL 33604]